MQPAIVLTDLDMPGLDGVELCRRLKDGPVRQVPVIILTANDGETERVQGLRAGADDYVNKSASMDELSARIESVMRRTGETERMRKLFARYTSDAVVEEILKSPDTVVLTGEKREVTVLFADIRNFTGLAESLPPEQVVGVLNQVLGRLSDAVLTAGGTLDKFLGDGLMAVWGAPVHRSDDALRALQAAKMMMAAMEELRGAGRGGVGRRPERRAAAGAGAGHRHQLGRGGGRQHRRRHAHRVHVHRRRGERGRTIVCPGGPGRDIGRRAHSRARSGPRDGVRGPAAGTAQGQAAARAALPCVVRDAVRENE